MEQEKTPNTQSHLSPQNQPLVQRKGGGGFFGENKQNKSFFAPKPLVVSQQKSEPEADDSVLSNGENQSNQLKSIANDACPTTVIRVIIVIQVTIVIRIILITPIILIISTAIPSKPNYYPYYSALFSAIPLLSQN